MTLYHHSPDRAGYNKLKTVATYRQVLFADIDPFLPLETKTELRAEIYKLGYDELRVRVVEMNERMKQS